MVRTGKYTHLLATMVTRPTNVAGGGRIIHGIYSDLLQGVRREPKIALSSLQVGSNFYFRDTPPLAAEGEGEVREGEGGGSVLHRPAADRRKTESRRRRRYISLFSLTLDIT